MHVRIAIGSVENDEKKIDRSLLHVSDIEAVKAVTGMQYSVVW
jgi:hypothetical protein